MPKTYYLIMKANSHFLMKVSLCKTHKDIFPQLLINRSYVLCYITFWRARVVVGKIKYKMRNPEGLLADSCFLRKKSLDFLEPRKSLYIELKIKREKKR